MPGPTYTHAVTSDRHEVILENVTGPLVASGEGPIHVDRIMFTYGRVTAADPAQKYPALGASTWHHYWHRPEWELDAIEIEGVDATRGGGRSQFEAYESWGIGDASDDGSAPEWLLELASRFLPHGERTARVLPGDPKGADT